MRLRCVCVWACGCEWEREWESECERGYRLEVPKLGRVSAREIEEERLKVDDAEQRVELEGLVEEEEEEVVVP